MRSFVIHDTLSNDRQSIVENIVNRTGAEVFSVICLDNRVFGCYSSHKAVMELVPPDEDILIFENDCEILNENFLEPLKQKDRNDIIYIGINKKIAQGSWGTHAYWISPRAKQLYLQFENIKKLAPDHIWNSIEIEHTLRVWRPEPWNLYVRQKPGLRSTLTGKIRGENGIPI